jgi:hypothetical protein
LSGVNTTDWCATLINVLLILNQAQTQLSAEITSSRLGISAKTLH